MKIATDKVIKEVAAYNEAEVRFHIIDPIIRKLGYSGGDDVYFKLEEKLEYGYHHIGRRNKKRDLPLGYPDYRAGLNGRRGCFVIEAKAGHIALTERDIEQAHSYAAHPQVGANFFVLSNGCSFKIFETLSGSGADPIVDLSVDQLDELFHQIENVLSPKRLAMHCQVEYDLGLKLCEGLGSQVPISRGIYTMTSCAYRIMFNDSDITEKLRPAIPQMADMDDQIELMQNHFELTVTKGIAKRNEAGRICAEVQFSGVTKHSKAAMQLLGVETLKFETSDKFVSTSPETPSLFESTDEFKIARGTSLPAMFGGTVNVGIEADAEYLIQCQLAKVGGRIVGEYVSASAFHVPIPVPGLGMVRVEMDFAGELDLELTID
ncbi:MAG: type I restriction enzyme HsdR N-terminal domain-containing protein [Pseudomonadota bacterium]